MKKLFISTLFLMQIVFVFAQSGTGVSGTVLDAKTQKPLSNVVISIQNTNITQLTNAEGKFVIANAVAGNQLLQVKSNTFKDQLIEIQVAAGQILDLGSIVMEEDISQEQQNSLITISEAQITDESNSSESTLGLLQSSRDVFLQAAAYNFGQARFSVRGIDNEYANVMINGISMNRTSDGRPQYGDWGGLNDATRNQEFTNGSAASDYVFGGIAGTQEINTRASIYRPGTRLSFLTTNTNYSYRTMATHASGMDKDGWAYVLSGGRRWAEKGYFEGTNYSANSFFASVEKRLNDNHSLNFTTIFTQNKRGKNSPNTNEQNSLAGNKYNSYWGYQNDKIRNSRFKDSEEPMLILSHYWKINPKNNLTTAVAYQFGKIGNSRLDFVKENNPDPTYYRKLPSYFNTLHTFINGVSTFTPDADQAAAAAISFVGNKQINWHNIYRVNDENIENGSRVVQYEDRNDENILTFNTTFSSQLAERIFLNAGVNYLNSKTENFKNLLDLLGGNYYTDINTFGKTEAQQQSDMNNYFRKVGVKDRYGYNYNIDVSKLDAFTQFKFTFKKVDFYLAQTFSKSTYQRDGLYKNGYYPNNSFGKSKEMTFDNFGFKGGLTYKLNGRNLFDFNAIYMSKAPNTKDVFPNVRVNNQITGGITNETIKAVDAGYIIRAPKLKARFTGYFSEVLNSTDINFYYADGSNTFVSEVVTGINKRNKGVEAGIEYQITPTIKLTGVAAIGDYTYTNNPNVMMFDDSNIFAENGEDFGESNYAGLKQAGMPQKAFSVGFEYRDPKFWSIGANFNVISDNYLDFSTVLRTESMFTSLENQGITIDRSLAAYYLQQEKFQSFNLLNVIGGKSWRIKKTTLGLFANINNLLDISYKSGGFEQSRSSSYRQLIESRAGGNEGPFAPKYFQGYGRTYMANIYLTF